MKRTSKPTERYGTGARRPRTPVTLDDTIRSIIETFLSNSSMSGKQFGQLVFDDPDFVANLQRGHPLMLDAADRALLFMAEPPIRPAFRREVEIFLAITGTTGSALGRKSAGDPAFVEMLQEGRPPRLSSVQKVRAWMRESASDAQRDAIARAIADGTEIEPALSDDPAALDTLVDRGASPCSDRQDSTEQAYLEDNRQIFLSTHEAAAFLNLSSSTLARYRTIGGGPAYYKLGGRVLHTRADLLAWAWVRRHGLDIERS